MSSRVEADFDPLGSYQEDCLVMIQVVCLTTIHQQRHHHHRCQTLPLNHHRHLIYLIKILCSKLFLLLHKQHLLQPLPHLVHHQTDPYLHNLNDLQLPLPPLQQIYLLLPLLHLSIKLNLPPQVQPHPSKLPLQSIHYPTLYLQHHQHQLQPTLLIHLHPQHPQQQQQHQQQQQQPPPNNHNLQE
jgi:hypothetical protein